MGLFSPSPKRIKRDEFKKAIKDIPQLSPKERAYVEGVFQESLKRGVTKTKMKREINRLKYNPHDQLSHHEVAKIKGKLEEHFKK